MSESKGTKPQLEVNKAENKDSTASKNEQSPREFGQMEAKNPNSLGPQFITKRRTTQDGGYRPYEITGIINEDPLFKEAVRVLGLESSDVNEFQNEIAEIVQMAATWTQSDRYDDLGALCRQILRRVNTGNSAKARLHGLRRKLQEMWSEEKGKK